MVKGDWLVILVLSLALAFGLALAGADVTLWAIHTISRWLLAFPVPAKETAEILAAWAWPISVLILAFILRRPLKIAAYHLARRFRHSRIKMGGGLLEIDAATSLIPLTDNVNPAEVGFSIGDLRIIEEVWEFAGASSENWDRLLSWISQRVSPNLEVEDFLAERIFAPERELAYRELIEEH
jgi:hypothetical protein